MEDFMNAYGGVISFDDDVCLFLGSDGEVPVDIPPFDDDE